VLGIGILPSGGDTKFVLFSHIVSSYGVCLPLAASMTLLLRCGPLSAFGSRALEELLKSGILIARYRTRAWQKELHT
jgi:Na+-driven multidrug efflux pump